MREKKDDEVMVQLVSVFVLDTREATRLRIGLAARYFVAPPETKRSECSAPFVGEALFYMAS